MKENEMNKEKWNKNTSHKDDKIIYKNKKR